MTVTQQMQSLDSFPPAQTSSGAAAPSANTSLVAGNAAAPGQKVAQVPLLRYVFAPNCYLNLPVHGFQSCLNDFPYTTGAHPDFSPWRTGAVQTGGLGPTPLAQMNPSTPLAYLLHQVPVLLARQCQPG